MKKTVKRISFLLALLTILSACTLMLSSCRWRKSSDIDGISYYRTEDKKAYYVQGAADGQSELVVPAEVDGKPVIGVVENGLPIYEYESITLPNSIVYVGPRALEYDEAYKKYNKKDGALYLGNSENPYVVLVKTVEERVIVADTCNAICDGAIAPETQSLIISKSVKFISPYAFSNVKIKTEYSNSIKVLKGLLDVAVDPENENYTSVDDYMLLNKDKTRLLYIAPRAEMRIPDTVEFAEATAVKSMYDFYNPAYGQYIPSESNPKFMLLKCEMNESTKAATIEDGVKIIAPWACYTEGIVCTVPDSVVQIMPRAFYNSTLNDIKYSGDAVWVDNTQYLDGFSFDMAVGCYDAKSKTLCYLKRGEWNEIKWGDPNFYDEGEYRRYE